jgi:hypothetical protein
LRHKRLFIFFVSLLSLALSFGAGVAVGKKSLIQPEISRSSIVSSDLSAKGSIKKENDVKIAENTPQEPPSLILVSQEMGGGRRGAVYLRNG